MEEDDSEAAKYSILKAASSTSKISGLKISVGSSTFVCMEIEDVEIFFIYEEQESI